MKILLTGANGFIGKNIKREFEKKYDIRCPSKQELDLLNTLEVEKYLKREKFDVVIHAANVNSSRNLEVDSYEVLQGNLRMFFNLERCKNFYDRMFYFGSGAEMDSRAYIPGMHETFFGENIPIDAYGLSKYVMGKEAEKENNIYNLRLFGVYGPYEEWEHRFISNAICRALKDLPITINQNVYFDYLWIDDLIAILEIMLAKNLRCKHYNVCKGERIDLLSLAMMVKEITGTSQPVVVKQEGLKREYTASNDRMLDEIGRYDFVDHREAISCLVDYYKEIIDSIDETKL